tara:strand:+ start:606 stop:809 length:204 start_codon:yes stop_codon:yes gene_type:complete
MKTFLVRCEVAEAEPDYIFMVKAKTEKTAFEKASRISQNDYGSGFSRLDVVVMPVDNLKDVENNLLI